MIKSILSPWSSHARSRANVTVMTGLLLSSLLAPPVSRADWHSHGSIHRSANINVSGWRGRQVDVHRDWNVHRDVDIDVHNHDHFWGGVAVGAATTIAAGAIIRALPPTHTTVVVANQPYHYSSGVFYQEAPNGGGYVTVAAPLGAIVPVLPPGATVVTVGPQSYFYLGGAYYQPQGTAFVVVAPPIGVIVPNLPPGATASIVNGQTYFLYQGVYYQPVMQHGVTVYTTVKI